MIKNIVSASLPGLGQVLLAQHPASLHGTVMNGWPQGSSESCFLKWVKEHRPDPGSTSDMGLTFVLVKFLRQELKSWQLFLPVSSTESVPKTDNESRR